MARNDPVPVILGLLVLYIIGAHFGILPNIMSGIGLESSAKSGSTIGLSKNAVVTGETFTVDYYPIPLGNIKAYQLKIDGELQSIAGSSGLGGCSNKYIPIGSVMGGRTLGSASSVCSDTRLSNTWFMNQVCHTGYTGSTGTMHWSASIDRIGTHRIEILEFPGTGLVSSFDPTPFWSAFNAQQANLCTKLTTASPPISKKETFGGSGDYETDLETNFAYSTGAFLLDGKYQNNPVAYIDIAVLPPDVCEVGPTESIVIDQFTSGVTFSKTSGFTQTVKRFCYNKPVDILRVDLGQYTDDYDILYDLDEGKSRTVPYSQVWEIKYVADTDPEWSVDWNLCCFC
jgi:hypothetical protein